MKVQLKSKFHLVMLIVIVLLSTCLTFSIAKNIYRLDPAAEKPMSDYSMELLDVFEKHASYFDAVMTEKEIKEKFQEPNYLTPNELIELSDKPYVEELYVLDQNYLNELAEDFSMMEVLALPELISSSPNYESAFVVARSNLIKGRFPKDNKNEIAPSIKQLDKFYHIDTDNKNVIGKQIDINGTLYKIVGIVDSPVAAMSFLDERQQYGTVKVDNNSVEKLNNIVSNMDSPWIGNIFIKTSTKRPLELLSYLEVHGPSYQYTSNYIDEVLQKHLYWEIAMEVIPSAITLITLAVLVLFVFGSKPFIDKMAGLEEGLRKRYYLIMVLDFFAILPICLLIQLSIVKSSYGMLLLFISLTILLIYLSQVLYWFNRWAEKRLSSK
ncbi:hypothetical protein HCJ25_06750 [Listeria sp. FSL L7-1426]|uniref:hypothetical protein n=1 Tax=Listeria cossartiae TaxID=2838249 RepID=UPI0016282764|nr:hypothetical protein [Listeria cossartiae]MBC1571358.1 hypothetical protein [Listeria cossartiae subsp. cossartiae]